MKTHKEKIAELTAEIRNALPRLMELSEGCTIKPHKQNEFIIDATYNIKKTNFGIFIDSLLSKNEIYTDDEFTIIGHEPMLNDVLEWFKIIEPTMYYRGIYAITFHGAIYCIEDKDDDEPFLKTTTMFWDLSKPYLKHQAPELIDFLQGLIK